MSAEFPTLAETVIATNRKHGFNGGGEHMFGRYVEHCMCGWRSTFEHRTYDDHIAAAVESAWHAGRTITSTDQLDALPDGSVILCASDEEVNRRTSKRDGRAEWWTPGSDQGVPTTEHLVPALLLWHPRWSKP